MARAEKDLPLAEPVIVQCVLCEGCYIEMRDEIVRVVGFIDLEKTDHAGQERRIVMRCALPRSAAMALVSDLRRLLKQGHH
jgi:hypothetical protein